MKTIQDILDYHKIDYDSFDLLSGREKELLIIEAFNSCYLPCF